MKLSAVILALGMAAGSLSAAHAMPVATETVKANSDIVKVRFGCGPGWHPNRWGRCVPNRRPPPPPRWFYHNHHHHHFY